MAERSNLPQVGCLLMFFGAALPVAVEKLVEVSGGLGVLLDLTRVLFFLGLILLIIGWLRNRRARNDSKTP
jgi:hypothetical protein